MSDYKIGDIVEGRVSGIEEYGIFLSFDNNISGLVHISEISDGFVQNIYDIAAIDDILKVKIIGYERDNNHLKLSMKELSVKNKTIKETTNGFSSLKACLDNWIEQKIKELK